MNYVCEVCGAGFALAHRYQVFRDAERVRYFCSEACRKQALTGAPTATCEQCGKPFALEFAYQQISLLGESHKVCSFDCRRAMEERLAPAAATVTRLCVAAQKGGTGKTTTAFHLAHGFAAKGIPTLLIDCDPQGSLTDMFQAADAPGLAEVLSGSSELLGAARRVSDTLAFLPVGSTLGVPDAAVSADSFKARLAPLSGFRIVVVDVSPAMTPLTEAALALCGNVLVPVSCDYLAVLGVRQLTASLNAMRSRIGRVINLVGVVPTFFDGRTRASRTVIGMLESYFPGKVLPAIRASADVRETGGVRKPVFEYSPRGRGAADYGALVEAVERAMGVETS